MIGEILMHDEGTISLLDLDIYEQTLLKACLELSKNRLSKADEERIQHADAMRQIMTGNRFVRRHQKHDVFTVPEVLEYYQTHNIDAQTLKKIMTLGTVADGAVYVTLEKIIERTLTYDRFSDRTQKDLDKRITSAANRLALKGFVRFFTGTPRFSSNSVCINLDKVRASIEKLNEKVAPQPVHKATKGKLHGIILEGDRPYDGDDDYSGLEGEIDLVPYDQHLHNRERVIRDLDDLTPEQQKVIELALKNNNRVTIPGMIRDIQTLSSWVHYKPHTLYMRLYRAAQDLVDFGIATIKKSTPTQQTASFGAVDGLIWISVDRDKVHRLIRADARKLQEAGDGEDLIQGYCEIPTDVNRVCSTIIVPEKRRKAPRRDPYAMPKNVSGPRRAAIRFLMGVKMLDYEENNKDRLKKRKSTGPYHDMKTLMDLFTAYSSDTVRKIIVMINDITGETSGSDYSTRFNDFKKGIEKLRAYEYAHDKSLRDHSKAVFLTLTTDPKKFPNLWVANRHMSIAFNQFMQNLTNKLGGRSTRTKYMAATEYTKTGLIHLHILIFDRTYLFSPAGDVEQEMISDLWQKCGQGEIVKAYGLTNQMVENGKREWRWFGRHQPSDARGMNGGDYLKKYLRKCMMAIIDQYNEPSHTLSPYWAFNKRFFTCSRSFLPQPEEELPGIEEQMPRMFSIHFIGYDMTLEEAHSAGIIDKIRYKRWVPRGKEPPDDGHIPEGVPS